MKNLLMVPRPQVNTKGLIAHYKLWAGLKTTGKVFDYALNGHGGILVDTDDPITLVPRYPGFDFDGDNDYITIPDADDFSFGDGSADSPFSISCWIKSAGSQGSIIAKDGPPSEWGFWIDAFERMILEFYDPSVPAFGQRITIGTSFTPNVWGHAVGTYDGRGGASYVLGMRIYMDGVRADTDQATAGVYVAMEPNTADVLIAEGLDGTFDGSIDDIMIFNRELSAVEVKSIYEITRSRYKI